jgi:hypothetical protein
VLHCDPVINESKVLCASHRPPALMWQGYDRFSLAGGMGSLFYVHA